VGGGLDIDARPGPHFARLTPLPPSTLGRVSTLSAAPGQTRASALLVASCGWQSDDNAAIAARKASAASRLIRHVRHVAHMPLRVCHCLLSLRSCLERLKFQDRWIYVRRDFKFRSGRHLPLKGLTRRGLLRAINLAALLGSGTLGFGHADRCQKR